MLSPIYQGTASSPRLNHVVASIYSFTEMHQTPPSRDTELHSLPPRDLLSLQLIEGNRQCIHTHTDTRSHTRARARAQPEGGKSSPQQRGHPSAAGFFQLEHLAGSAVIYGNWFLTWGFFCYDRDPPTGEGRPAVKAGEERKRKRWGAEGQRQSGEDRGTKGHRDTSDMGEL